MSADIHDVGALGAYALGALKDGDRAVLEAHLDECPHCREHLLQLEEMAAALDEVPPEMFMDGAPEDADLIVPRVLATVRKETSRRLALRRASVAVGVAVAVAVAGVGGVLLGNEQERDGLLVSPPPVGPNTSVQPSGTRVGSNLEASTGARMTVTLTPAVGWVRINAAVTGIPAGQRCRLWVVSTDGTRKLAASWLVSKKGAKEGTTLDGAAIVAPADVAAVEVDNFEGDTFVSVPF